MFRRRGTFDVVLPALMLLAFSSAAFSADFGKRGKKEYMGACGEADAGLIYVMTNGSDAESCDPDQAVGDVRVYCACDSDGEGGYAWTTLQLASGGESGSGVSDGDKGDVVVLGSGSTWTVEDVTCTNCLGGTEIDESSLGVALLAGDEDGQVIQGIAGENKAKLDIGTIAQLRGEGAAPGYVQAAETGAYLSSADESTYLDLYDGVIEFSTDGVLSASADVVRIISGQTPPTNANDPCTAGDTIDTASFHYYCAATNTWVRVAMATWP